MNTPFSRWQIVFALVQLETVIALGAVLAHLHGSLAGGTLATLLVGLLGTSRVPAAVRIYRDKRPGKHDDDDPKPGNGVVLTSGILTLFVGLAEWKALLRREVA